MRALSSSPLEKSRPLKYLKWYSVYNKRHKKICASLYGPQTLTSIRASGKTASQYSSERRLLCNNSLIDREIACLEHSHWLFPCG